MCLIRLSPLRRSILLHLRIFDFITLGKSHLPWELHSHKFLKINMANLGGAILLHLPTNTLHKSFHMLLGSWFKSGTLAIVQWGFLFSLGGQQKYFIIFWNLYQDCYALNVYRSFYITHKLLLFQLFPLLKYSFLLLLRYLYVKAFLYLTFSFWCFHHHWAGFSLFHGRGSSWKLVLFSSWLQALWHEHRFNL